MSTLPEPSGTFEPAPIGTHMAVCYRVLDLGRQTAPGFDGKEKVAHQIMISWELPEETMGNGQPFTISRWYNWTMHEKSTLRKHLEAWRGRPFTLADFGPNGFNIRKIIGAGCLLNVVHKENGKAKVAGVSPLMKTQKAPPLHNEASYLWLLPELWEPSEFFRLPQGLQAIIMKSPEYAKLSGSVGELEIDETETDDDMSDEVPF